MGGRITRRGFLSGSGAVLAGALAGCGRTDAGQPRQAAAAASLALERVVDVHHHFWPDSYQKLAAANGGSREPWTPQAALETMEEAGLGTAMLSMSNWVAAAKEPTAAQLLRLCRECNDYGARMVADHPSRFGLFASLMVLPDVNAALKELEYALDTLKADGIGLMSHYGQGTYLGDPELDPVLEEMNRRGVVAFVHPASPWYEYRFAPDRNPVQMPRFGSPDLPFDTTRAVMNILERDTAFRFPNIKFIWPHAGGTAIVLLSRAAVGWRERGPNLGPTYDRLAKTMATFYYDLALTTSHATIAAIQAIAPPSHMLFGSDIPRAGHYTRDFLELLPKTGLAVADLAAIGRGNAEALFPRLRQNT